MKILVLIHEFPPVGGGGGPIARDLSLQWVRAGHQVRIVTAKFGDLPEYEVMEGLEIVRLKSHRTESFRAKMGAMIGFITAASKYCCFDCRDFQPDLIHVHFAVPNGPAAMLASGKMKVPYVITAHLGDIPGASPEKTKKWFQFIKPFTPPIWKKAARVIAVSEFSRRMALNTYDVPIDVIPNGIDYEKIRNKSICSHSVPEIVFAGRFVPQKNILQIIKTLTQIKDLSWHATLIGDGQDREMIIAEAERSGITDRLSLPGWKTPEEVIDIFHRSDILFMPSTSEGLSVTGIQGMASGLALLLSNAGGNPEIIKEGWNGSVFEPDDTAGYTAALRKMLSDPDLLLRMRNNSCEMAASFDIRKTAADYLKVFDSVLQKKPA
ncbi:MAG: glycosyltransferase family 4 protein [Anaerolineaceae bacterium]|nr:glycosyltransferase family 4 protein [Anaerolineaceae bacterium]